MMKEKLMVIDVSKCTGCRSCQVACKQWKGLPAEKTVNTGSYQNPPDLGPNTCTLVRFREVAEKDGGVQWLFWKDGCMHCNEATCMEVCPVGAISRAESGAIVTDYQKCVGCQSCVEACPFAKPRYNEKTNKSFKCDLCADRIENGLLPACVKACPTGALQFGDKDEMLAYAYKRVREIGGEASVYGDKFFGGTHVVYVLDRKASLYNTLPANPKVASSVIFWKDLLKPLWAWKAATGAASLASASYGRRFGNRGDRRDI
jgi:formate dehydrogenase iron-sulfur subunit